MTKYNLKSICKTVMAVQLKIRFVIVLYVHEALYNMYLMQREVVISINAELLLLSETGQSFVLKCDLM